MDELIKTFHIELNLLLAQLVNFAIVLLVLYKFAYKPILKILNDRTKKIEKGLKDSEEATKKLENISLSEKEILARAKKEAQEIIKKADESAKSNREVAVLETKSEAEKMLATAKKQIEQEKEKMIGEIKAEVADLVVAATGKIIGEKLDKKKDKELIEKSIR
jgi:F-type H+-transporting ATPase subunit b